MESQSLTAVVLAAGQGKRMRSDLPKVLHPVCGRPMLSHVLSAVDALGLQRKVVVLGHGHEQVRPHVPSDWLVAFQDRQLGTGHAVLTARELVPPGLMLVLPGDMPLMTSEALKLLLESYHASQAAAAVLTMRLDNPAGYGRILRDSEGFVRGIVEEVDASADQRLIDEVNTGVYVLPVPLVFEMLQGVGTENKQHEMYLTDVVSAFSARGQRVVGQVLCDATLALGVNSPEELALVERVMAERLMAR